MPLPPLKPKLLVPAFLLVLLLAQFLYYAMTYNCFPSTIPESSLVLVYSGGDDRISGVLRAMGPDPKPLFLFSGWEYSKTFLEKTTGLKDDRFILEDQARTTEQNARFSAPLIKGTGAAKAILALPWYHLPRALFLTRFYLIGSGVEIVPYATAPLPPHWWATKDFFREYLKFWGSLGRMALAVIGIENWPRPHSLPTPKL